MDTTLAAPEPFTYSFDLHDPGHCAWRVEAVAEELADHLAALLEGCEDVSDALDILTDVVDDHDPDEPDSLPGADIASLEAACAQLKGCLDGCYCSHDAWEGSEQDYLNTLLAELGDRVWDLDADRRRRGQDDHYDHGDHDGALSVDALFAFLEWRDGWDRLSVSWDATHLEITFSGYPGSCSSVSATALSGVHLEAYRAWSGSYDDRGIASQVLAAPEAVLVTALAVVAGDAEERFEFPELVEALTAASAAGLDTAGREALVGLVEEWQGSLEELVDTANLLCGPASSAASGYALVGA